MPSTNNDLLLEEVENIFPNPRYASDEGLLAYGGDLKPQTILKAYSQGIFPWYSQDDPILWWSPNPRLVLYPNEFKESKSLKRVIKNKGFKVKLDTDFETVIEYCSTVPRKGQDGNTWLSEEMKEAYIRLHRMGYAHSVETYYENKLVGGFYGLAIGKTFFGESMFSLVSNASKVALKFLSDILVEESYDFIDCQVATPHLISLGARTIDREDFLNQLEESVKKTTKVGSWKCLEKK